MGTSKNKKAFGHLDHKIIENPKVIDESKIVEIPMAPGFLEKRLTLRAIKNLKKKRGGKL